MTELTTALEKASEPRDRKTVFDLIERQRPEIAKLLGSAEMAERMARITATEIRRTPKLLECDPLSLIGAMMLAAQLGLEPGPLGHVYLVPFNKRVEFIIGYRGYVDLAYRSGQVKDVATGVVFEGDSFDWREGSRPYLDHTPAGPQGEREFTHAWALARLKTGGTVFRVLFPADVEKARKASASGSHPQSPWATEFYAMARKTAVRRLAPMLPTSPALVVGTNVDDLPAPVAFDQDVLGAVDAPAVEDGRTEA